MLIFYIASLFVLAFIVIAFLVLLNQQGKRVAAANVLAHGERSTLLQRIQAPEFAVAEHHAEVTPTPAVEPRTAPEPVQPQWDSDEAYWAARGEPTRDEFEAALARAEGA